MFSTYEPAYREIGLRAEPMVPVQLLGRLAKSGWALHRLSPAPNSELEIWAGEKGDTAQGLVSMVDYFLWGGSRTTCTIIGTKFSPRHGLGWHNIVYGCS